MQSLQGENLCTVMHVNKSTCAQTVLLLSPALQTLNCCITAEARSVVQDALHSLEQLPIYDIDHLGNRQPLTLEHLDSRSKQMAEQAGIEAGSMYNMHKAFGGNSRPRQAYAAAVLDFTTAITFLKSLNSQLHMPAAAAAAAAGRVKNEKCSDLEVVPVVLEGLSLQLQDAADGVESALDAFRLEEPQGLQAGGAQLQQLSGSQEQWEQIVAAAGTGLDPGELVQWLKALKQQRDALNKATSALEEVPEAGNENAFVGACADVMCAVEQHLLQTPSFQHDKVKRRHAFHL